MIKYSRGKGYEISSKGDKRFSALYAKMPDGRTIEEWYQCDVKGYDPGGKKWRLGKGSPPRVYYPGEHLWYAYLTLWRIWATNNVQLVLELYDLAKTNGYCLRDSYGHTNINQARALATILNEWVEEGDPQ